VKLILESTSKIVELMPGEPRQVRIMNLLQRKRERNEGITLTAEEVDTLAQLLGQKGVPARLWEGKTESGISCHAFVTRVAVADPSYEIEAADKDGSPATIKCNLCGRVSSNPHDVKQLYCGGCKLFHYDVHKQFEAELQETRPPSLVVDAVYPARMVL
jgi:hypothetical protein